MTGEAEKPFDQKDKPACAFESRTSSWDAFVIYAVDPCRPWTAESDRPHSQPGGFGHLEVPYNALPIPPGGESLPIHYNQPIILQCVTSGVLSPIMIIRKVERGSIACGGGLVDAGSVRPIFDLPSAPGEPLGEPVSQ